MVFSSKVISPVLISEDDTTQLPIYYISKALLALENCYPDMEKLAVAFSTAYRKLRPYFQAHTVHVLTNVLLKQVLQKLNAQEGY